MMDHEHSQSDANETITLLAQAAFSYESRRTSDHSLEGNFFKSAEWSPDGTCIVTNSADNHIRTIVVPPNLLETREEPLQLQAYLTISSLEPVNALTCFPNYDLQDPSTTLILSTASEHPIRLNSALDGRLLASYPLISPTTEAYIKPQSLLFTHSGSRFLAGSESSISIFDVSRPGQEPLSSLKTGPKNSRAPWSNPATALRGLISALAVDEQHRVLAAGTLSRAIALYDSAGQRDCIGAFSVSGNAADDVISGGGITQVFWSKCGRYLFVAERKSDGCMVYDIRNTGQLLSWTVGRDARTNQRMKVELATEQETGRECVWAGGVDGTVRQWLNPHLQEGAVQPSHSLFVHNDSVNSTSMHGTAGVLATASGQRTLLDPSQADNNAVLGLKKGMDNALKLWLPRPSAVNVAEDDQWNRST